MSRRIEAVKQGARRRRRTLVAVAVSIAALGVFSISALAVHDEEFQLDGNTVDNAASAQDFDWESFFNSAGAESPVLPDASRPGFDAAGFDRDFNTNANGSFNTSDASTFSTGSKDTLPITPGWQCGFSSNVNSKTDVTNAYAVSYTDPTGDEILYFGLERNANTGTGNIGFWFLQDEVSCETTAGNEPFVGDHVDGDLLIVSEFSNGGAVATIQAYEWEGGANGALNPNPVAAGASCTGALGGDSICAVVNTENITTSWLTANKQDGAGHTLRVSEFFEAGLNLTDEGLGGKCFNTFMGVTRSSTSLTATIFDFSLGTLGECTADITTTPKDGAGNDLTETDIPATGTLEVKDSAEILVNGADTFDATVTFHLCGPGSLTSATDTCDTGGVQIGDPVPVTANGTVESDSAFLTAAGRYCWRGDFSGDETAGVPEDSDSSEGECFTVNPLQPELETQATIGPVPFGMSITDTVSLTGTADQEGTDGDDPEPTINATRGGGAGGTIHVDVYGPDSCDAADIVHSADITDVDGDGNYGGALSSLEFVPQAPGEYVFVASYSGDDPNTLGVDAIDCADQPSNERVVVQQIPTEISTAPFVYPNDTATISSSEAGDNLPAGGTVTFRAYVAGGGNTALENCEADDGTTGLLHEQARTVTGGANSEDFSTNNTSDEVSGDATVYWKVTYATGDTAHTGSQSDCAESTAVDNTDDAGPGTLFP